MAGDKEQKSRGLGDRNLGGRREPCTGVVRGRAAPASLAHHGGRLCRNARHDSDAQLHQPVGVALELRRSVCRSKHIDSTAYAGKPLPSELLRALLPL